MMDDPSPLASEIRAFFADRPQVQAVYLYGSVAAGTDRPDSDVDIGVLVAEGQEPDLEEQLHDSAELSALLHREVDLVTLNRVSPILRMQVLRKGKLFLNRNPRAVHHFFVRTINEYFDLKMVRRPIENKLYRVSIYG